MKKEETRLNKYISESGFCSRREADQLIIDQRVTVNGVTAQIGMQVKPTDRIKIDGETLKHAEVPLPVKETAKRAAQKSTKPKSLYERKPTDPSTPKRLKPRGRKSRQGWFSAPRSEQAPADKSAKAPEKNASAPAPEAPVRKPQPKPQPPKRRG